jgi:uncharacterized protein YdaU (DUF1376 family)
MTAPLTPPDCDLRDFPFMPIDIVRLFNSEFHALADDAEWRAGMTLWLKSYHQVPAASLPDDDIALCRLAELGRDLKTWRKVKERALHGWVKCDDGRLYHKVVAEKANEAWERKKAFRDRTEKARQARLQQKKEGRREASVTRSVTDAPTETVTRSVTETTGTEDRDRGQGQIDSEPDGSGAADAAPPPAAPRDQVWGWGLALLSDRTGKPPDALRGWLGRMCKRLGDGETLQALIDLARAGDGGPVDPIGWFEAGAKGLEHGRSHTGDRGKRQGNLDVLVRAGARAAAEGDQL